MKKDLSIGKLNDVYGRLLTDKQRELIELFYDDDLSLGEIAENSGITRQAAHDAIVKGVASLKKYESELKLSEVLDKLSAVYANKAATKQDILEVINDILNFWE